jgi:hypothetical protein
VATLAAIRAALNSEIAVITDAETAPWTQAARNQAISDGYSALWRVGVWKPVRQDITPVTSQFIYALTSIRRLQQIDHLNSSGFKLADVRGVVEDDGAGGYQLRLKAPIDSGTNTLRVRGWTAYVSTFANDAAVDDLPAEYGRIPRLKAKAILYRQQLATFARYGERQAAAPVMNMTIEQLIGVVAAAEREFADEAKALSSLRPRAGQTRDV